MSPKKEVPALNSICLKSISDQLIQVLSDDEGDHCETVSCYLMPATYEILQDLLKIILRNVNLDASTRYNCLEAILREDVKQLETGIFPRFYYEKILETITYQGKRIQQLNLKGVWACDYPELLCKLIQNLKNLRTLVIPHMADDDVISAILSLKELIVLDICGEACYSLNGIRKLKSDTIRLLDIGNFGKAKICSQNDRDDDELGKNINGYELIAQLIENLPNLTVLKTYSFTGKSLLILYQKNKDFRTKLSYLHDTGTTMEVIEAIITLCPNLESMHIDSPKQYVIEEFWKLKGLTCLKLTKGDGKELMNYLHVSGDKLHTLKINHNKNFSLDLSEVCLLLPNLINLECFQMKLIFTNIDTYFMSLQNVEILYTDMSEMCLKYILCNSPFLKRFVLGCVVNMTDGDVFRICAETDFACLEELWFSYARGLTGTSVELLMGHCPNLKVIGELNGWDIRQEEVDYLRYVIMTTNCDLTLFPNVM